MAFDEVKNFSIGVVQTPPSPSNSGTTLTLVSGNGAKFPTPVNGYNVCIWPGPNVIATDVNTEIVRVTGKSGDTLTITRTQEGATARNILQGDYVILGYTAKTITDLQTAIANLQPLSTNLTTYASKTPPSGSVVGTTDTQSLTHKNLTDATNTFPAGIPNISSPAQGDVMYFNGTSWVRLAADTAGKLLQTNGAAANPSWANVLLASNRQGGDASNWSTAGTTNYTPGTGTKIQVGSIATPAAATLYTVTFPVAFTNAPLVLITSTSANSNASGIIRSVSNTALGIVLNFTDAGSVTNWLAIGI